MSHLRGQRQLLPALGQLAHQRADTNTGLHAHLVFAELDDFAELAQVHGGAAVAADAARLRIISADEADGRRIVLGVGEDRRDFLGALRLHDEARPSI